MRLLPIGTNSWDQQRLNLLSEARNRRSFRKNRGFSLQCPDRQKIYKMYIEFFFLFLYFDYGYSEPENQSSFEGEKRRVQRIPCF